uniref:Uncharacterized protein n=1 Tax=Oryza rufipogon TaxID=4529 RepID=A0A0E0QMQ4_ORYRU
MARRPRLDEEKESWLGFTTAYGQRVAALRLAIFLSGLAMSVRKVAAPSKMSMVTEETVTSVKASPAGGVSVRRPHTVAITVAASLEPGFGAKVSAQWQPLTDTRRTLSPAA